MTNNNDVHLCEIFKTPAGGILTVGRFKYKRNNGHKVYSINCSICSKDEELWPVGSITSSLQDLKRGRCPCGCSKRKTYSEHQQFLRIGRMCKDIGYIFHGWDGEYTGIKTYLKLENQVTGNKWNTTTLDSFLMGRRDPSVSKNILKEISKRPLGKHIEDFLSTGRFEGFIFNKSEKLTSSGYARYWNVICPKCSNDEFVIAGVCSGIFTALDSSLKKGNLPCRCSKNYRYTKDQYELMIKKICSEEDFVFIGWDKKFNGKKTYFSWVCDNGHNCRTTVDNFLGKNVRCRECYIESGSGNGYYKNRKDEQDWLYLQMSSDWIKCGRTFRIKDRIIENSNSSGYDLYEIAVYTGSHKEVFKVEQEIRNYMEKGCCTFYRKEEYPWCGCRECYLRHKENIDLIRKMIHASGLEIVHENGFR